MDFDFAKITDNLPETVILRGSNRYPVTGILVYLLIRKFNFKPPEPIVTSKKKIKNSNKFEYYNFGFVG